MTDNGALDVGDAGSGAILTLDDCTTISGSGTLTINACNTLDVDGGTTTIDLGGTITNNGTLEASCGGELDVVSHVDNSSGMLEAKSGGKLDIESAISGGSATIQGGTLEFGGKSNVDVTFDNSHGYGQLTLDHAENFCGTITDFTGTCADSAHSDVIDLKDINFDSCGFHECYDAATGMLTVTDGTHTAYLKFDDFNGTFKFGSDGGSGTDIYDPPVTGSKDAPSTTPATTTTTTTTSAGSDHTAAPADNERVGERPRRDVGARHAADACRRARSAPRAMTVSPSTRISATIRPRTPAPRRPNSLTATFKAPRRRLLRLLLSFTRSSPSMPSTRTPPTLARSWTNSTRWRPTLRCCTERDPEKLVLALDPGMEAGFPKRSCSNKMTECQSI